LSTHKVAALVFPSYAANSETHFDSIEPIEAMYKLINAGFSLNVGYGFEDVEKFIRLLTLIPKYRLTYSKLNEAHECLQTLQNQ
jgi:hypothetical protein